MIMDAVSSSTPSNVSSIFQEIIAQRQKLQAGRIGQGLASGQLTQAEADRLNKSEAKIDKLDQDAMADGSISGSEFARIMHAQNKASHRIYSLKHNGQTQATGSNALLSGVTGSNAQLLGVSASNASISQASNAGSSIWSDMSKLFQDIAQLRQTLQADRIQNGVDSGQITTEEQQKLQAMETSSNDVYNQAMSDGTISPDEFMQIMQAQNATSRHIHHYRHNRQFGDSDAQAASGSTASAAPANYQPVSVTV